MPRKKQHTLSGRFVKTVAAGGPVAAFLPDPLPPHPPLDMNHLAGSCSTADRALAELKGISSTLPGVDLFLYSYVRKEALLSAQIEGTQSSLSDLFLFEKKHTREIPLNDVQEVSSYIAAMQHGLKRIREDGFPLSLRLLREIHAILLSNNRGKDKAPGEFRRNQNWISAGNSQEVLFVPPPADEVMNCMGHLETFLHSESPDMPILIKAALAHAQFETIHPFLDGNGRLGRLLVTLLLCSEGALSDPLLYLSLYLKRHRQAYYKHLQAVRMRSAWEAWVRFFLDGVREISLQAVATAEEISSMFAADRKKIERLGRPSSSVLRVHDALQKDPFLDVALTSRESGLSGMTVRRALHHLQALGIVREISGRKRGQIFCHTAYMEILSRGTEPLALD